MNLFVRFAHGSLIHRPAREKISPSAVIFGEAILQVTESAKISGDEVEVKPDEFGTCPGLLAERQTLRAAPCPAGKSGQKGREDCFVDGFERE